VADLTGIRIEFIAKNRLTFYLLAAMLYLGVMGCGKTNNEDGSIAMIKQGAAVKIHYTLTVGSTVVDSSMGKDPLSYTHGTGQLIPGLEEQIKGMTVGEKKKVVVSPDKGYGELDHKAIQKVPKKSFQNTEGLKIGGMVSRQNGGRTFQAKITEIGDEEITLDFNHPLAGKTLNFDIEVVDVLNNNN